MTQGRVSPEQFTAREERTDVEKLPPRAPVRKRTVGPSRAFQEQKINNRRY